MKKQCLHNDNVYELFKISGTQYKNLLLFSVKDVQQIDQQHVLNVLNTVKEEINKCNEPNNTKLVVNLIDSKNLKMSYLSSLKTFLKQGRPIFKKKLDSTLVILPLMSAFWEKLFKILLFFVPSSRPIEFKKQDDLSKLYKKLL